MNKKDLLEIINSIKNKFDFYKYCMMSDYGGEGD